MMDALFDMIDRVNLMECRWEGCLRLTRPGNPLGASLKQ